LGGEKKEADLQEVEVMKEARARRREMEKWSIKKG